MRRVLGLLLLLAACNSHDSLTFRELPDLSPFAAQRDGRIRTNTSLDAVAVGLQVPLSFVGQGFTTFTWSLEAPAGSAAALSDPSAATPTFTPDVEGDYFVGVTATGPGGAEEASRRIIAASFIGMQACADCHTVRAPPVAASVHGQTNVDCESCHGPGSRHDGDPRLIGITLRAQMCGDCHNGTVASPRFAQWEGSSHGKPPPAETLSDPSCVRCHTAQGYLDFVAGAPPAAQPAPAPGVTCAACHDPHTSTRPAQVRVFGSVPLTSGRSFNAGRAAACLHCHQSDVADPAAHAAANLPFPCAVQADMVTARGGVQFGLSFGTSFHGTTVFRLRSFTGDPADSNTPDSCVICHMAPGPAGALEDVLGGHAMRHRQGLSENAVGNCDRCHPGLDDFDLVTGDDFDGDGQARGVQTEVKGLVEVVFDAIRAADAGGAVSRPGGALTPAAVAADLTRSTPELRQAVYNYNFVVEDGTFGVHNTTYAVQLLQRTHEQLTGLPFATSFPAADVR